MGLVLARPILSALLRRAGKRGTAYSLRTRSDGAIRSAPHNGRARSAFMYIRFARLLTSTGEQAVTECAPRGAASISESAGGVRRRFGEGLLTSHHLGEQPPGDGAECETVMGMAKGEP
jgi:hypothetical protein